MMLTMMKVLSYKGKENNMKTSFNEDLIPSYELTKEETDLLNKQGYVLLDNNEFCLVEVEKNQYVLFKVFDEYKSITLSLK